jgi:HK97 family phage major capsid protein
MKVIDKRAALELRAQADAIRTELLDGSKTFTADEVKAKSDAMSALMQRADMAAALTADDEIERQGSGELVGRAASENTDTDSEHGLDYGARYKDYVTRAKRVFGGPNGMLRRVSEASRGMPLTVKERAVLTLGETLEKRSTIVGTAGDASGGEFLLPLQQDHNIFLIPNQVAGVLEIARQFTAVGRSLRIPYMVQTSATVTRPMAGIANVSYVAENASITEVEPTFAQRLLNIFAIKAYSEIGNETLVDDMTGQLPSALQQSVGQQVLNFVNEQVTIDGTGSGASPTAITGALNAANGALYQVTRNTAAKVLVQDIFEMYARFVPGPNSRWLIHPNAIPQIMALTLNGTTLVTWLQNLNSAPTMQLLGIPVVVTPLVSLLGAAGDVNLVNGDFMAVAMRQGLSVESSRDFKFQNGVTAYRFNARAGGVPIPTATYSYKATGGTTKTYQVSPFVQLL